MKNDNWCDLNGLELGEEIDAGRIDPLDLSEYFLELIKEADPDNNIFIRTLPDLALPQAKAASKRAAAGLRLGPLDGVPMCWKDLTDTKGIETTFASAIFRTNKPDKDALLLARANQAGLVCIGKTNLSEFAYSGLGINPTFGTPASAGSQSDGPRVPGGSSSGTGVAVGRKLVPLGIGSDTGGSVRIPGAYNGVVGLKTTWGRLPLDGMMALSPSLDTIGPLTRSVADANAVFAALDGSKAHDLSKASLKGATFVRPTSICFDDMDEIVSRSMDRSIDQLKAAGAKIVDMAVPEFDEIFDVVAENGNIISVEGYALWEEIFDSRGDEMYWGILDRFKMAKNYSGVQAARAPLRFKEIRNQLWQRFAGYDGFIMPTTPIVPPLIKGLEEDPAAYDRANMASTRNTRLGNLTEACAVTLPCQAAGELPVGLMLMAAPHSEGRLLRLAHAMELAIAER